MLRFLSSVILVLGALATIILAPRPARTNTAAGQEQRAQNTASPIVREIDLAAFKQLLQRDSKQPRPLLINFWATWCDPCREEFPDLVRIDTDYRGRGLEFITISLDDTSQIKTGVPEFLKEVRASMPSYLLNTLEPDVAIAAVDQTWSGELPATFLFDARGQLVFKHKGRIKTAQLRAAIEKVMSDK